MAAFIRQANLRSKTKKMDCQRRDPAVGIPTRIHSDECSPPSERRTADGWPMRALESSQTRRWCVTPACAWRRTLLSRAPLLVPAFRPTHRGLRFCHACVVAACLRAAFSRCWPSRVSGLPQRTACTETYATMRARLPPSPRASFAFPRPPIVALCPPEGGTRGVMAERSAAKTDKSTGRDIWTWSCRRRVQSRCLMTAGR